MKKTYISPEILLCNVELRQSMLADSAKGTSVFDNDADPGLETLSRRSNSIWDDDDEEDF